MDAARERDAGAGSETVNRNVSTLVIKLNLLTVSRTH